MFLSDKSAKDSARILITGGRSPAALHVARLLADGGCYVIIADSMRWPISARSRACHSYHYISSPVTDSDQFAVDISNLVDIHAIDLVVPTCEEIFHLAMLWAKVKMGAKLYAPPLKKLAQAHNKFEFIQQASKFGLQTPDTRLLLSPEDIGEEDCNRVLKPVWSRFASKVLLRPRYEQLRKIQPSMSIPWVSQERIEGREICALAFCNQGAVLGQSAYQPLYRAGQGAGIFFEPFECGAVADFVATYVRRTNWTGQISFDFMQEEQGDILPLECNPRSTSGVHFFLDSHSFAVALLDGKGPMEVSIKRPQAIKFAMLSYGILQAVRAGHIGAFIQDYQRSVSALSWAGDAKPAISQFIPIGEIVMRAVRHRCSLTDATTRDIQWDGPGA
ncbi:MAG: hypothetical protein ABJN26_16575 [Stappiaceae bacterium]